MDAWSLEDLAATASVVTTVLVSNVLRHTASRAFGFDDESCGRGYQLDSPDSPSHRYSSRYSTDMKSSL
jgi:hypothetical protein